jgi:uncharacterized protein YggT (Ycf19 family)
MAQTTVTRREVVETEPPRVNRAAQLIYLVAGILVSLLAFRFVLRLLGASTASPFVNFVYDVTYPLVAPFIGIFGREQLETGVFEFETLIAMAVYGLVAYALVALVRVVTGRAEAA